MRLVTLIPLETIHWSYLALKAICTTFDKEIPQSLLISYFTTLARHWQQVDLFEVYEWKCPDDEKCHRAIVEQRESLNSCWASIAHLMKCMVRFWGPNRCPLFVRCSWKSATKKVAEK